MQFPSRSGHMTRMLRAPNIALFVIAARLAILGILAASDFTADPRPYRQLILVHIYCVVFAGGGKRRAADIRSSERIRPEIRRALLPAQFKPLSRIWIAADQQSRGSCDTALSATARDKPNRNRAFCDGRHIAAWPVLARPLRGRHLSYARVKRRRATRSKLLTASSRRKHAPCGVYGYCFGSHHDRADLHVAACLCVLNAIGTL